MSADKTGSLDADHKRLEDDLTARRYFDKLSRILGSVPGTLSEMVRDGLFLPHEAERVTYYAGAMLASVRALSMKYLVAGRIEGPLHSFLTIDIHESGFPVWSELAQMATDAAQAAKYLARTPAPAAIKDEMVREIVGDLRIPTRLQYALSQRYYNEALAAGDLFWPQMHPVGRWSGQGDTHRRRWLLDWAVYDSQLNVPVIYLMDVDDTGRRPLTEDIKRWSEASAHLMAQSVTGLQLVTIAQGFDRDFATLHPHRLRRIVLGPVYSREFTVQEGPIRQVLDNARADSGDDWALAMTVEDLRAKDAVMESSGLFSVVERQIYQLDPLNAHGAGQGASSALRALTLPARPYQALVDLDPPGFRNIRKYVPGPDGRVTGYR